MPRASIYTVLVRVPTVIVCFHRTVLRLSDFTTAIWRPIVTSIGAGACLYPLDLWTLSDMEVILRIVLSAVAYAFFYVLFWVLMPGGRDVLADLLTMWRLLRKPPEDERSLPLDRSAARAV